MVQKWSEKGSLFKKMLKKGYYRSFSMISLRKKTSLAALDTICFTILISSSSIKGWRALLVQFYWAYECNYIFLSLVLFLTTR